LFPPIKDNDNGAQAINAVKHKDKFAAAETTFTGQSGQYNLVLSTLTELDDRGLSLETVLLEMVPLIFYDASFQANKPFMLAANMTLLGALMVFGIFPPQTRLTGID
jgi:hypothetical protein